MNLKRYYLSATVLPSVLTVLLLSVNSTNENLGYESEWFTKEGAIAFDIFFAILYCLLFFILDLPILLNKIEPVRKNEIYRLLTWFLLPMGFVISSLIHEINFNAKYNEEYTDFTHFLLLNTPFTIGLIWTYLLYTNDKITSKKSLTSHISSLISH